MNPLFSWDFEDFMDSFGDFSCKTIIEAIKTKLILLTQPICDWAFK